MRHEQEYRAGCDWGRQLAGGDASGRRPRNFSSMLAYCLLLCLLFNGATASGQAADEESQRQRQWQRGQQLLRKYCISCHGDLKQRGDLNLQQYETVAQMMSDRPVWSRVLEVLQEQEMPPQDPIPSAAEYRELLQWVRSMLDDPAWVPAEQAGHVTFPRLTRAEYRNTMRDLLGVELHAAEQLNADGQGLSGFNNDRDPLFTTTADVEKYLDAADAALKGVLALSEVPQTVHLESEAMLMTETREIPQKFGDDFVGYVLNRGQMTLYESIDIPVDGYYRFTIRALSTAGPTGAVLQLENEQLGGLTVLTQEPALYSLERFLRAGSYQMTWNLQQSSAAASRRNRPAARKYRELPKQANEIVTQRSARSAPRWPATDAELRRAPDELQALHAALIGVQRPYEWLRLLDEDGDPAQMKRFRGYIMDRLPAVRNAMLQLGRELRLSPSEVDVRFREANRAQLDENAELYARAGRIVERDALQEQRTQSPGRLAIDWVEVTGPHPPEGSAPAGELQLQDFSGTQRDAEDRLQRLASRAFRRPVSAAETADYGKLFQNARAAGVSAAEAFRLSCTAILVSPHFLYRVELNRASKAGATKLGTPLTYWELASRLSYFLWLSMPDEPLRERAADGRLLQPDVLAEEVQRMLQDSRMRAFAEAFSSEWLGTMAISGGSGPDAKRFPDFNARLAADMREETTLMFAMLLQGDGTVDELLSTDRSFLNARLADHYGISGVRGNEFRLVDLRDSVRGGLLGMGSVLTATSSPTQTSPVVRGKWILETLLGQSAGEPPPDAGALPGDAGERKGRTLREELEQHRRDPACAACHSRIDPLGFGLEQFDAIGRFRTRENGQAIDATGVLPGGHEFSGAAELKRWLVRERADEFRRNLARRLLSFVLGRQLESFDEASIRQVIEACEVSGGRLDAIIEAVLLTKAFRQQDTASDEGH